MNRKEKAEINGMTYEELLRRSRFAKIGDRMFHHERGRYFKQRMQESRRRVGEEEHQRVSKLIGWGL